MALLDQPPSPRAATAPDGLPDMEQRVAGLRREIAEEQAAALAVAVQALHPPERSQNMSREAPRQRAFSAPRMDGPKPDDADPPSDSESEDEELNVMVGVPVEAEPGALLRGRRRLRLRRG